MFPVHKKNLPSAKTLVISLYIGFSLIYILANLWINFKNNVMQWSYLNGKQALLQEIIKEADATKCQPFTVFLKEQKVELVNTQCLQRASEEKTVENATE